MCMCIYAHRCIQPKKVLFRELAAKEKLRQNEIVKIVKGLRTQEAESRGSSEG